VTPVCRKSLELKELPQKENRAKIGDMDTDTLKNALQKLILDAKKILEIVNAGDPVMPGEAARELAGGICLRCKKKIAQKDKPRSKRGCHEKCYVANLRAIKAGNTTEIALIESGHMAPKSKGGRPPIPPCR
jgi:hypothetical protein